MPRVGVVALLAAALVLVILAGGEDQEIVQFYAGAVFLSFLGAVVGNAVLSWRERRLGALAVNVAGVAVVALVLLLNLRRLDPVIAIAALALASVTSGTHVSRADGREAWPE